MREQIPVSRFFLTCHGSAFFLRLETGEIGVVSIFFIQHCDPHRISLYAADGAFSIPHLLFLLSRARRKRIAHRRQFRFCFRFVVRIFRIRNAKTFAANQILDSTRPMSCVDYGPSKLCADKPRHATRHRLAAGDVAQLGKGGDPPLHPLCRFWRHAETVPVSAPSVLPALGAHIHGTVFP